MSTNIRVQRICEYCGNEFTAKTTRTRYCSHTCNSRAYKAKKRTEKLQEATADKLQDVTEELAKKIRQSIEEVTKREFLSITDACTLIGVSRWTLWRAIKSGELTAGSIGRRKLIRRADIEALIMTPAGPVQTIIEHKMHEPREKNHVDKKFYYSIGEAQEKYGMSPKAFYDLLERHEVEKIREGRYVYVSKDEVDRLFNLPPKSVST